MLRLKDNNNYLTKNKNKYSDNNKCYNLYNYNE